MGLWLGLGIENADADSTNPPPSTHSENLSCRVKVRVRGLGLGLRIENADTDSTNPPPTHPSGKGGLCCHKTSFHSWNR